MLLLAQHTREVIILETRDGPIELRLHVLDDLEARIGISAPTSVRVIRQGDRATPTTSTDADPLESEAAPWWQHPDEIQRG